MRGPAACGAGCRCVDEFLSGGTRYGLAGWRSNALKKPCNTAEKAQDFAIEWSIICRSLHVVGASSVLDGLAERLGRMEVTHELYSVSDGDLTAAGWDVARDVGADLFVAGRGTRGNPVRSLLGRLIRRGRREAAVELELIDIEALRRACADAAGPASLDGFRRRPHGKIDNGGAERSPVSVAPAPPAGGRITARNPGTKGAQMLRSELCCCGGRIRGSRAEQGRALQVQTKRRLHHFPGLCERQVAFKAGNGISPRVRRRLTRPADGPSRLTRTTGAGKVRSSTFHFSLWPPTPQPPAFCAH